MKRSPQDEFGAFEKNTKGFGMKMLMKMGYKPGTGLGKEGEGIVNPIEATVKVGSHGLGFAEEFLSTRNKAAKSAEPASAPKDKEQRGWRKKRQEARQDSPQTAPTVEAVRIIDYTSRQVRELTSLSEMNPQSKPLESSRFPELRHNLRLLVKVKRRESQQAVLHVQTEQRMLCSLEEELQTLEANIRNLEIRHRLESSLRDLILELLEHGDDATGARWLQKVHQLTANVKDSTGIMLLADGIMCGVLTTLLRQSSRDILHDRSLQDQLVMLRPLCNVETAGHVSAYEQAFTTVLLPPLRALLVNSLHCADSVTDGNVAPLIAAADVFHSWLPLVPPSITSRLISQTILPSLHRIVDGWRAERPPIPLYVILSPWIRCISGHISSHHRATLYPAIRRKLTLWLQTLPDPSSKEAVAVLINWRPPMLPTQEFDIILGRVLLPALQATLSTFTVNPKDQDITPIEAALDWVEVIPASLLAPILAKAVFPKLMHALHAWMTTEQHANYKEITQWYGAWKALFPAPLMEHSAFQDGWKSLLIMMNQLLDDPLLPLKAFMP